MEIKTELVEFTPERKSNPFDGVVAQVIDAGDSKAARVTIPQEIALSTAQSKIREAAKDAGQRARIRAVDEQGRVITFTLSAPKTSDAEASDAEAVGVSGKG